MAPHVGALMPQNQLSHALAERTGLDVALCASVLYGLAQHVQEQWRQGHAVSLPGVGSIMPQYFAPRDVISNLPGQKRQRYRIGLRKSARLIPARELRGTEDVGVMQLPDH